MHELSIARAVIDTALHHARGRPVSAVEMRVGRLRQVVPRSLAFCFEAASRGTGCEGAELRVEAVEALMRCGRCGRQWDPSPPPAASEAELVAVPRFRCPGCGEAAAEVLRGEELEIEAIMVEDTPVEEEADAPHSGQGR